MRRKNNNLSVGAVAGWPAGRDKLELSDPGTVRVAQVMVAGDGLPASQSQRWEVSLLSPQSRLEMLLIWVGRGEEYLNMQLQIKHLARQTTAKVWVKAVLLDQSSLDFLGNLQVPAQAQDTDTYFRCDTLLLSPLAHAKTIPSLEIVANEVKAGHAATVGRPDEEILFYLQCRGLDESSAYRMMVEAFLYDGQKVFSDLALSDRENMMKEILASLPLLK